MKELIDCAMRRKKADLVIKNVKIFNVFTGELEEGEIAVKDGFIFGISTGYRAEETFDGGGKIALPGFIDAHIHIESSLLSMEEFTALAVAHGTSAVIADPHEIVNVCGVEGAKYFQKALSKLNLKGICPLDLFLELPSCVPATSFETSGAHLNAEETERELNKGGFFGLGEMMNFPAVIEGDEEVLKKISAAKKRNLPVDGHAPLVKGNALNAYLCAGIKTDHESLSREECREKIARGMYLQIRCGSSANNLEDAAKVVDGFNFSRFLLCSDDKNAADLHEKGHIDDALRRLVAAGYPAKYALLAATKNICDCYHLKNRGAIAPGYFADIVLVDDMQNFSVQTVFKRGKVVASKNRAHFQVTKKYLPADVLNTVHVKPIQNEISILGHGGRFRAMEIEPHALLTHEVFLPAPKGELKIKDGDDLNKLFVIERHFASGNIGKGLLKGFGFHGGALGISVGHDSHNLTILGDSDEDILKVFDLLSKAGGGMAISQKGGESLLFPLDIAGLMSSLSYAEVIEKTKTLSLCGYEMGVKKCYEPFMTPAFLSLAVIPHLKLTDRGYVNLEKNCILPLEEE